MTEIQSMLFGLRDEKYALFIAKLTPTIDSESVIGVRMPILRQKAKEIVKSQDVSAFLQQLPHQYYEENILHGLLLGEIKDYNFCVEKLNEFLPYVDNWAVCDITSPKIFKKNKQHLLPQIVAWTKTEHVYTIRFGIEMLMSHFLDDDFKEEYLAITAGVKHEDYYVKMMVAWFFATALAKQWNATLSYIKERKLTDWTHRKTIQKACESYRITAEQKELLRRLK